MLLVMFVIQQLVVVELLMFSHYYLEPLNGSLGIAHNGNIVNANVLKADLEKKGSIFSSSSDTEILGHLIMREEGHMIDRICNSLNKLDGAFAFLILI